MADYTPNWTFTRLNNFLTKYKDVEELFGPGPKFIKNISDYDVLSHYLKYSLDDIQNLLSHEIWESDVLRILMKNFDYLSFSNIIYFGYFIYLLNKYNHPYISILKIPKIFNTILRYAYNRVITEVVLKIEKLNDLVEFMCDYEAESIILEIIKTDKKNLVNELLYYLVKHYDESHMLLSLTDSTTKVLDLIEQILYVIDPKEIVYFTHLTENLTFREIIKIKMELCIIK